MKEHRTTEEEVERPTTSWWSRNRKHAKTFRNMVMTMMMKVVKFLWLALQVLGYKTYGGA